jgi:hypothetical protein
VQLHGYTFYKICISAIAPVALFSMLIWERRRLPAVGREDACLPVGREDRNAKISICVNYILVFLPTGKTAQNQITKLNNRRFQINSQRRTYLVDFIVPKNKPTF